MKHRTFSKECTFSYQIDFWAQLSKELIHYMTKSI
uniref:Uncharacterized protein n=1 Tax=Anguilla anguilla TaxID=7936 RepID=A0A0E9SW63_ANGAN